MQLINSPEEMQAVALAWRRAGKKIALVPTMGALHEGHISLVRLARRASDVVVLSIFVNPIQFGPGEDFEKYPRNLTHDSELCRENDVDIIFCPPANEMYLSDESVAKVDSEPTPAFPASPERFAEASGHPSAGGELRSSGARAYDPLPGGVRDQASPKRFAQARAGGGTKGGRKMTFASNSDNSVFVGEDELSKQLCGAFRPGHFRGVLTVVAKLFNIVLPDLAVFGQKDAQQAILIQRMIRDLNFPVRAIIAPIIREADGLAMSSRNSYLGPDERKRARCLSAALKKARELYRAGERDCKALKEAMRALIAKQAPSAEIEYIEIVDTHTLKAVHELRGENDLVALAVRIGKTRLIDNLPLPADQLGNLGEE